MVASEQQLCDHKLGTTEKLKQKQLSSLQRVDESAKGGDDHRW